MLRVLPLADDLILPQARQEIYFFNRISRKQLFTRQIPLQSRNSISGYQTTRPERVFRLKRKYEVNGVHPHADASYQLRRE